MAHFLVPPGGGGIGYDVDSKLAPGSIWRRQIAVGTERTVALWGGAGLFVRSNNPAVVPTPTPAKETKSGDLRILHFSGMALGTSMLEVGQGTQVWASLQVQVVQALPAQAGGSLVQLVPRPNVLNPGLSSAGNPLMLQLFGSPRAHYSSSVQGVTDLKLKKNMTTANVGPFRVTGLKPAVDSLRAVMADIRTQQPTVYKALGTAGMLACRLVRGSSTKISNHSWGTAIDLTISHKLDTRGDNKVQYGLTLIAPIFNRHGWYWGAGFPTEDGMHFEGSKTEVQKWATKLVP
jgi:hypothetical protein